MLGKKIPPKRQDKTKNLASACKMLVLPDESERTKAETVLYKVNIGIF